MTEITNNQYLPDYAQIPGEILLETLEERGMTQAQLAERTGRKRKTINQIIKGIAPITPETALQLERVLGVPARFWNNLEGSYRENLARLEERERLNLQMEWMKKIPVREMIRKGWIKFHQDRVSQFQEILNFFGVVSPQQWKEMWEATIVSFRKSPAFSWELEPLTAWLRKGELAGQEMECEPYDKQRFSDALMEIRSLTVKSPQDFQPAVERLCSRAGVAVVFIPELPKIRVSGATRWLTPQKALIQLSLRYKTNDHLWFTFYHEAAHILLHGKKDVFIHENHPHGPKEEEANRFAADLLIPPQKLNDFIHSNDTQISKKAIKEFAEDLKIAPGIVVGRLQHEDFLRQSQGNDLKMRLTWKK